MPALVPWPHQPKAFQDVVNAIERGCTNPCLTSVTGSGKSLIMQMLCEWAVNVKGWTVAILSNRRLLTMQLARGLNASGIHVGIRAADFESWTDPGAPVQVCSVPTETSRVLGGRKRAMNRAVSEADAHRDFQLFEAQLVLVDECHIQKGATTRSILQEYRAEFGAAVVGITATPLGVGNIYSELIMGCNMTQGRACGALVLADCYEPSVMDLGKIYKAKNRLDDESGFGLPSQAQLEKATQLIWTQHVVGSIYKHWKKLNPDARPSLGFAPGVKESLGMAQAFYREGVNAAHLSGTGLFVDGKEYNSTQQEDRDELFARAKAGEIPMIWNRFVCREAIDLPWIEYIDLSTPIGSLLSYVQTVGRGLRASPSTGKTRCTIVDHCGNIRLHGSPNMDRDFQWVANFNEDEDKVTRDRIKQLADPNNHEPDPITCPECGAIRKSGPKCHKCGLEHTTSVRHIIQHDGTLVRSTEPLVPKKKPKSPKSDASLWAQCYFRAKNSKKQMTFKQVRGLFKYLNNRWPPDGLPWMPRYAIDWARPVRDVTPDRLHH